MIVIITVVVTSRDTSAPISIPEKSDEIIAMEKLPATTNVSDMIVPDVVSGSQITSPQKITGKARGNWYFEASFPIELQDNQGNVIAVAIAQAQGEWMTEDFVPFSANLVFPSQVVGSMGKLVLKKDNPSGMPEHDASLIIPVQF